jgi:hypothetical protein
MKTAILHLIFSLYLASIAQDQVVAKVELRNGIPVFVMCEPFAAHQKVTGFYTTVSPIVNMPVRVVVPGMPYPTRQMMPRGVFRGFDPAVKALARKTARRSKKEKRPFNAFTSNDCRNAIGILFGPEVSEADRRLAKPLKIAGKDIYMFSKPVAKTELVMEIIYPNRIVNNRSRNQFVTLIEVVNWALREADRNRLPYDAIQSSDGIRFKCVNYIKVD